MSKQPSSSALRQPTLKELVKVTPPPSRQATTAAAPTTAAPTTAALSHRPASTIPPPTRPRVADALLSGTGIKIKTAEGAVAATVHTDGTPATLATSSTLAARPASATSRPRPICKYYHTVKGCNKGTRCPAVHCDDWRHNVVRAPWSPANLVNHPITAAPVHMWTRIVKNLSETTPRNGLELEELMLSLLPPDAEVSELTTDYSALIEVVDRLLSDAERRVFLDKTLPWMKRTLINAPRTLPAAITLMAQSVTYRVTVTDRQAATLLCCAFFSIFPDRHRSQSRSGANRSDTRYSAKLPNINFGYLFGVRETSALQKIRCLIEYFTMRCEAEERGDPVMQLEFIRVASPHVLGGAAFRECHGPVVDVNIAVNGTIEDCNDVLQVDFANVLLGGGVIGRGCVQEEIRFVTCPELFVARLLSEQLLTNETVYICGARQYTEYSGYSSTFAFTKRCTTLPSVVMTPAGERMFNVAIVAMDATNYKVWNMRQSYQFSPQWLARDTDKAFISFSGSHLASLRSVSSGPIATGNWGCGAFGGDQEFKFLIQLCAASHANRPLRYYTFGDEDLASRLRHAYSSIREGGMRVSDLYRTLEIYCANRFTSEPEVLPEVEALQRHSTAEFEADTVDWLLDSVADVVDDVLPSAVAPAAQRTVTVLEHLQREIDGTL